MAFGGAAVFLPVGSNVPGGFNTLKVSGLTLAANVGAFDPTGAAADSGLLNSNNGAIDPVPANTISLPVNFGPGPDNWAASDVTAALAMLNDSGALASNLSWGAVLIANVNPLPAGVQKTNNNVRFGVHNKGAAAATGLQAALQRIHTFQR